MLLHSGAGKERGEPEQPERKDDRGDEHLDEREGVGIVVRCAHHYFTPRFCGVPEFGSNAMMLAFVSIQSETLTTRSA